MLSDMMSDMMSFGFRVLSDMMSDMMSFGFRIFCWYRGFCHRTG